MENKKKRFSNMAVNAEEKIEWTSGEESKRKNKEQSDKRVKKREEETKK
jgi:hypothetical protein